MTLQQQRILVTDGEHRAALAAIRSLGNAGHSVVVAASRVPCIGSESRHAQTSAAVPSPMRDPRAFARSLWSLAEQHACDWILPVTEESLLALDPADAPATHTRLLAPPLGVFQRVSDKAAVLEAAASLGMRVPVQWTMLSPTHALPATIPPHVALKSARSVSGQGGARQRGAVEYANSLESARRILARTPMAQFPMLVQERIRGQGIGVFLLRWDGRTVARFAHRRIREKPPTGGVSVCSESAALDASLAQSSERLVAALGLDHGVAMVEFKLDGATGAPVLMEINGRLWGSLQLAIDAGVDFPALWLASAMGQAPLEPPSWTEGVRLRWRWGEVDHVIARVRRRYQPEELPTPEPLWRSVAQLLRPLGPMERGDVARPEDPKPGRFESLDWFRNL